MVFSLDAKQGEMFDEVQVDIKLIDPIIEEIDNKIEDLKKSDVSQEIDKLNKDIRFLNHKEKLSIHFSSVEKAVTK